MTRVGLSLKSELKVTIAGGSQKSAFFGNVKRCSGGAVTRDSTGIFGEACHLQHGPAGSGDRFGACKCASPL